jgi:hypothetical protein
MLQRRSEHEPLQPYRKAGIPVCRKDALISQQCKILERKRPFPFEYNEHLEARFEFKDLCPVYDVLPGSVPESFSREQEAKETPREQDKLFQR